MQTRPAKVRLFVDHPFPCSGHELVISGKPAHYLRDVMRLTIEDRIRLFNGQDGEWIARLSNLSKRTCQLSLEHCARLQRDEPGPWLYFALLKRDCTDLIVEKATELGVERLQPVITVRTVVSSTNLERLRSITIEAAEQCGRLTIPTLLPPVPLTDVIDQWPDNRCLMVMDPSEERGIPFLKAHPICSVAGQQVPVLPPGIVIGPEGGLSASELDGLLALPFVTGVSLGPLVLRAETAAIAALVSWQALAGTWIGEAAKGAR